MSGKFRIAAGAALIAAIGAVAACASSGDGSSSAQSSSAASQSQSAAPTYTDAQIQAFVAARGEIQQMTPATTPEAQAQQQTQIRAVLQRHGLTTDVYTGIIQRSQTDQALANRISAASASSTTFTDAQLQAFATASAEIDPITRTLSTATPEQQPQATLQIRQILARNNLTFDQYNGIAARAQTDDALAARITALRSGQPASEPPANQ